MPESSPEGLEETAPEPALQGTPQTEGLATISEFVRFVGLHVSEISPWIAKDVKNFEKCPLDKMLKELLMECTVKSRELFDDAHKTWLFEDCLEKVVHICNGEAQANNTTHAKSSEIKENLVEYTKAHHSSEETLYPLFVTAANVALRYLAELEIDGVRPPSQVRVCFHVNDPSSICQYHQGIRSIRKPDVVIVSEADVREGHEYVIPRGAIPLEIITAAPHKHFEWRDVRTFIEFKKSGTKMKSPPDLYILQKTTPPPKYEYQDMGEKYSAQPASPTGFVPLGDPSPALPFPRRSARLMEKAEPESDPLAPPSKRRKVDKSWHHVIVQAGYYATEMFAAHVGRSHVFGVIVVDDVLYLWRYDRQGNIQCSGLNFVQDLPRFLVLLFILQRFQAQHWGLNSHPDPEFGPSPESCRMKFRDDSDEGRMITVDIRLLDRSRVTHFGLNGRATNLFPVTVKCKDLDLSPEDELMIKIFWVEIGRIGEPEILKKVYEIAKTDPDVEGHVPVMLGHKAFKSSSTGKIRQRMGLKTEGARVLCMIIFHKLRPITELDGDTFLSAWWATVKCHLALWKNGVYHRDISPSNLMYRKDKNVVMAVLNDFDLASIKDIPTGTRRTGTVSFMALPLLLGNALQGKVKHLYEHDAESFIWVLVWVALQYEHGNLRGDCDRPLDEWLRNTDVRKCTVMRSDFLIEVKLGTWDRPLEAGGGYEKSWELGKQCMLALLSKFNDNPPPMDVDRAFERLLGTPTGLHV